MALPHMRLVPNGRRRLTPDDIPQLLDLQERALPDTMAARFGPRFNTLFTRTLLEEPEFFCDGFFSDGELVAFITYTPDVRRVLRGALRKHALAYAVALARSLMSPRRLAYVARIVGTVLAGVPEAGGEVHAELLSMGVLRDFRGAGERRRVHGVSASHALTAAACDALAEQGIREVKVFCKPEEIEPVANGFFVKQGFVFRGRVRRFGIAANLYVKQLGPGKESNA